MVLGRGDVAPNRALRAVGLAASIAFIAYAGYLAYEGLQLLQTDAEAAVGKLILPAIILIVLSMMAFARVFQRRSTEESTPAGVSIAAPTSLRAEQVTYIAPGRNLRVLGFAIATVVLLAAGNEIANSPGDPFTIVGAGGFVLIGLALMFGAWRVQMPVPLDTKLRYIWWALAGLFLILSAEIWVKSADAIPLFLFAPAAIVFTVLAARASIRYAHFGASALVLEHDPVMIGQTFRGEIRASRAAAAPGDNGFTVRLFAYSTRLSSRGPMGDRIQTLWSSQIDIPMKEVRMAPGRQVSIPIEFALLPNAIPSGRIGNTSYDWQIDIRRPMPGIDYAASFNLRVAGDASSFAAILARSTTDRVAIS